VIHAADVGSGDVHAWHALSWHSARAAGMKTHGEIEAAVCEGFARFVQDFMGRGPKEIRAHLVVDLVVVRLRGILSAAEISLAAVLPPEKGRDMLKNVRTYLLESSSDKLRLIIETASGSRCTSMYHDVSTLMNEEIFVFTLHDTPVLREAKHK
jgi:uncharacterized protein YbcI